MLLLLLFFSFYCWNLVVFSSKVVVSGFLTCNCAIPHGSSCYSPLFSLVQMIVVVVIVVVVLQLSSSCYSALPLCISLLSIVKVLHVHRLVCCFFVASSCSVFSNYDVPVVFCCPQHLSFHRTGYLTGHLTTGDAGAT